MEEQDNKKKKENSSEYQKLHRKRKEKSLFSDLTKA